MHVLCFTHGEASTLNENHAELRQARARELRQAAAELGIVTVTLLDYSDGQLAAVPPGELSGHVTRLCAKRLRIVSSGCLVLVSARRPRPASFPTRAPGQSPAVRAGPA